MIDWKYFKIRLENIASKCQQTMANWQRTLWKESGKNRAKTWEAKNFKMTSFSVSVNCPLILLLISVKGGHCVFCKFVISVWKYLDNYTLLVYDHLQIAALLYRSSYYQAFLVVYWLIHQAERVTLPNKLEDAADHVTSWFIFMIIFYIYFPYNQLFIYHIIWSH